MYTLCKHLGHVKSLNKNVKSRLLSFWGVIIFFLFFRFPSTDIFFIVVCGFCILYPTHNTDMRPITRQYSSNITIIIIIVIFTHIKKKPGRRKPAKQIFFYDFRTHRERPVRGRTTAVVFEGRPFPPITRPNNARRVVRKRISIIAMQFFPRLNISAVTAAAVPRGPRFTTRENNAHFPSKCAFVHSDFAVFVKKREHRDIYLVYFLSIYLGDSK